MLINYVEYISNTQDDDVQKLLSVKYQGWYCCHYYLETHTDTWPKKTRAAKEAYSSSLINFDL